jgi:hypothetical protein
MDPMGVAGMVFVVVMTALIGGMILLAPVAKRLGLLLEMKIRESGTEKLTPPEDSQRLWATLDELATKVDALAERQAFDAQLLLRGQGEATSEEPGQDP